MEISNNNPDNLLSKVLSYTLFKLNSFLEYKESKRELIYSRGNSYFYKDTSPEIKLEELKLMQEYGIENLKQMDVFSLRKLLYEYCNENKITLYDKDLDESKDNSLNSKSNLYIKYILNDIKLKRLQERKTQCELELKKSFDFVNVKLCYDLASYKQSLPSEIEAIDIQIELIKIEMEYLKLDLKSL